MRENESDSSSKSGRLRRILGALEENWEMKKSGVYGRGGRQ